MASSILHKDKFIKAGSSMFASLSLSRYLMSCINQLRLTHVALPAIPERPQFLHFPQLAKDKGSKTLNMPTE